MKSMKIKISNEADRMTVAAILIKNGYRVHQDKQSVPGKKTKDAVLIVDDTKNFRGEQP